MLNVDVRFNNWRPRVYADRLRLLFALFVLLYTTSIVAFDLSSGSSFTSHPHCKTAISSSVSGTAHIAGPNKNVNETIRDHLR